MPTLSDSFLREHLVQVHCLMMWADICGRLHGLRYYADRGWNAAPQVAFRIKDDSYEVAKDFAMRYFMFIGFLPVELVPVMPFPNPQTFEEETLMNAILHDDEALRRLREFVEDGMVVQCFDPRRVTDRLFARIGGERSWQSFARTLPYDIAGKIGDKAQARALAREHGWSGYAHNERIEFGDRNTARVLKVIEAWRARGIDHVLLKDPTGASGVGTRCIDPTVPEAEIVRFLTDEVRAPLLVIEQNVGPHVPISVLFKVTPQGWSVTAFTRQILTQAHEGEELCTEHCGNGVAERLELVLPHLSATVCREIEVEIMRICGHELDYLLDQGCYVELGCDLMVCVEGASLRRTPSGEPMVYKAEWNARATAAHPPLGTLIQAHVATDGQVQFVLSMAATFYDQNLPLDWRELVDILNRERLAFGPDCGEGIVLCAPTMLEPAVGDDGRVKQKMVMHAVARDSTTAESVMRRARRLLDAQVIRTVGYTPDGSETHV